MVITLCLIVKGNKNKERYSKKADSSDTLIDGGLYYKKYPCGRETIVADLNDDDNDGVNDSEDAFPKGKYES